MHISNTKSIYNIDYNSARGWRNIESIIDYVPPMLPPLSGRTFLKVLEDNDAVIHMCIKSRAPKLRHLARTLRIDLDWLFERFQTDPAITITYINTKSQAADIFTKANFTGIQWNALKDLIQTRRSKNCVPLTLPDEVKPTSETPSVAETHNRNSGQRSNTPNRPTICMAQCVNASSDEDNDDVFDVHDVYVD